MIEASGLIISSFFLILNLNSLTFSSETEKQADEPKIFFSLKRPQVIQNIFMRNYFAKLFLLINKKKG